MECEQCHERPARVRLTRVENGQTIQDIHLCERCAAERGESAAEHQFSLHDLLASLLSGVGTPGALAGAESVPAASDPQLRCPRCGYSYLEFARTGLLGCPECYDAFSEQLAPLIRRIHGKSRHEGKVPTRGGTSVRRKREIDELRRQLALAVSEEAFERAADLRDRLRAMEASAAERT